MRVAIARRSFRPSHDHRIVGKCNCWTQLVRPAGLVHARVERSEARGELETAGSETLRGTWRVVRPAGLEPATSWFVARSQSRPTAAGPGETGSAVPHRGRSQPVVDACSGTACKFLQARNRTLTKSG